jgi:hypothetical protein
MNNTVCGLNINCFQLSSELRGSIGGDDTRARKSSLPEAAPTVAGADGDLLGVAVERTFLTCMPVIMMQQARDQEIVEPLEDSTMMSMRSSSQNGLHRSSSLHIRAGDDSGRYV